MKLAQSLIRSTYTSSYDTIFLQIFFCFVTTCRCVSMPRQSIPNCGECSRMRSLFYVFLLLLLIRTHTYAMRTNERKNTVGSIFIRFIGVHFGLESNQETVPPYCELVYLFMRMPFGDLQRPTRRLNENHR